MQVNVRPDLGLASGLATKPKVLLFVLYSPFIPTTSVQFHPSLTASCKAAPNEAEARMMRATKGMVTFL